MAEKRNGFLAWLHGQAEKRGLWMYGQSSDPALARSGFWTMGTAGSTGITVNEETAFTYPVFWACVNNIATDIATFPLMLFKREPNGGKEPLRDHKLFPLLHDAPNPEMTSFTFRGLLTSNALTWGMGYAEIVRNGSGQVVELWPITPSRVSVRRRAHAPHSVYYDVSRDDGRMDTLRADQMFVLPGSTVDGVVGRNIVNMAKESIGLGLAAERFGGTFYGNGSTFGGVFEHPSRMSEQALKNFKESVNAQHKGVDKAHKFIVTEEGMKYQKLGVDPNQAQFLETRQHQVEEICRWFRMPPHKVQHLIRTSYNSVEQMNIEYSSDTLQPWCVRWEQEVLRQLIAPSERRIQFVKHNMNSKLRGDTASRYEAHAKGIQFGFLSADDAREMEDLNPLPDGQGKVYLLPQNMVPADQLKPLVVSQIKKNDTPPEPPPPAVRTEDILDELRQQLGVTQEQYAQAVSQIADLVTTIQTDVRAQHEKDVTIDALHRDAARLTEEIARQQSVILMAEAHQARQRSDEDAAAQRALDAHAVMQATLAATENLIARLQAQLVEAEARRVEYESLQAADQAQRAALEAQMVAAERDQTGLSSEVERLRAQLCEHDQRAEALAREAREAAAALALVEQQASDLQATLTQIQQAHETVQGELHLATLARDDAHQRTREEAAKAAEAQRALPALTLQLEAARMETAQALDRVVVAEQARDVFRQSVARHLQKQTTEHRKVFEVAGAKIVRIERDRATRNSGTPAKLQAWADGFYLLHIETAVDAYLPFVRQHLTFIESDRDPHAYTRALVEPAIRDAHAQILAIAKGDPDDLRESLERLLTRWEHDRPAAIADAILQEEVTYVRQA